MTCEHRYTGDSIRNSRVAATPFQNHIIDKRGRKPFKDDPTSYIFAHSVSLFFSRIVSPISSVNSAGGMAALQHMSHLLRLNTFC